MTRVRRKALLPSAEQSVSWTDYCHHRWLAWVEDAVTDLCRVANQVPASMPQPVRDALWAVLTSDEMERLATELGRTGRRFTLNPRNLEGLRIVNEHGEPVTVIDA